MSEPRTPVLPARDVDAAWMSDVLRAAGQLKDGAVTDVSFAPCGPGQLADSYRFELTYSPEGAGPATVVGKFASEDPTSRAFGQETGFYRSEVRFYESVAQRLSVAVPTPIYAALHENETDFVVLLDDLAPARVVDQLVGATPDEAAIVVEQAAVLHAGSWYDKELARVPWLRSIVDAFLGATDQFPAISALFREQFGDLVPEHDLAEAAKLNDYVEDWKRVLVEPRCLWHSDFRVDNMLFDAKDGAIPVAILDWQTVGMGVGTIDLAYFLGGSLTTEDRRTHERDLVQHYHAALVAHGVEGYSFEDCWADYRVLAIEGLQTGLFGAIRVKRTERGDEMWRVWIERHAAQTRDLDSFTALKSRA